MSKGSIRRKCLLSPEEEDLHWDLFMGKINKETFDKEMEKLKCQKK